MFKRFLTALLLSSVCLFAVAAPGCWPKQLAGTGQGAVSGSIQDIGEWRAWWCEDSFSWSQVTVFTYQNYSLVHPKQVPASVAEAFQTYWTLNVNLECTNANILCKAATDAAATTKPIDPVWQVVAGTGTDKSRATSTIVNHALKASTVRAAAGEVCECKRLAFINSTSIYCGVRSLPNVALCKKV